MTEQEVAFSFKKKPIDQYFACHSHISDILPQTDSPPAPPCVPTQQCNQNTVDYNQQIRAPRFHFKTDVPFKVQYKPFSNDQPIDEPEEPEPLQTEHDQDEYHPATFDLSNPFRKFSISSTNLPNNDSSSSLLNNYTTNNYIYNKSDRASAINNLNDNLTSEERRLKNYTGRINPLNGHGLQQVYQMKKPMCVPAVLRPNDDGSGSNSAGSGSGASSLAVLSSAGATSNGSSNTSSNGSNRSSNRSSISADTEYLDYSPEEPTHKHWKPNNTYCMLCFGSFSNIQIFRKRRHHCRFCGIIICTNCLYVNEELNNTGDNFNSAYLDPDCRLVVPVFKNFNGCNLNFKSLSDYFKLCKICKKCGENYMNLLLDVNGQDVTLPFVFIENPYLKGPKIIQQEKPKERKPSVSTGLLTDWNWSSF